MIKFIVTGTRSLQQPNTVESILAQYLTQHNPEDVLLIHGGCRCVDLTAKNYAERLWVRTQEYKPDWNKYGKAAGPIRNRLMLEENMDAVVLAFPSSSSKGTINCINQAKKMGMIVHCHDV